MLPTKSSTTTSEPLATVRRHRPDYQIVLFSGILVLLSVVVLFSISPARVELINLGGNTLDEAHFMQRQVMYLIAGLAAFGLAAALPLRLWQKYATKLLILGFGLCLLLLILGAVGSPLALCTNGACRWFNLGFTSFQPAELMKFALLIYAAGLFGKRISEGRLNSVSETLIPIGLVTLVAIVFIIGVQKDMGTGITLLGMLMAMLLIAGLKARYFLSGLVVLALIGTAFIITSPHRIERIMTFVNPSLNDAASNYHIEQASIAIGSGGLTGVGLGHSVQAFGYLPEAPNDSIFAILGEIFGFIGLLAILAIFFALLVRLLKVVDNVMDPTLKVLAAGIFGWLATHTVVNIGAMIGVFPLTGVTLPFLSFGGTSLLFTMLVLGLAFHISRYTTHRAKQTSNTAERNAYATARRGRGIRRSRYASSRGY